jgi:predicted small secreted protein
MLNRLAVWLALTAMAFAGAGCNTDAGVGKDIKATGNAVEQAAKKK